MRLLGAIRVSGGGGLVSGAVTNEIDNLDTVRSLVRIGGKSYDQRMGKMTCRAR